MPGEFLTGAGRPESQSLAEVDSVCGEVGGTGSECGCPE